MSESRGKFIVIEGGEGSGKSTCISYLKQHLSSEKFVFTREPGGSPLAEAIRGPTLRQWDMGVSPYEQLLIMEATRSHHVRHVIKPALEQGRHVICDRFTASTYAYQIYAQGEGKELEKLFRMLESKSRDGVRPDKWIFLVLDPKTGRRRKQNSGGPLNYFDDEEVLFYQRVQEGLKKFLSSENSATVDASLPTEKVAERVLREVLIVTDNGKS